jgi:hypothetical protein
MRIALRCVVSGLVFAAATVAALHIDPGWAATTTASMFTLPQTYLRLEEANEKKCGLDDSFQDLQARIERKKQIVQAVREQRLPLRAAVKEFLAASQDCWYEWDYEIQTHPEWSKEKRCAQIIVDSVSLAMEDDRQFSVGTLQALETELVDWADN